MVNQIHATFLLNLLLHKTLINKVSFNAFRVFSGFLPEYFRVITVIFFRYSFPNVNVNYIFNLQFNIDFFT